MNLQTKKAFTLIELLVVMVILAILWTIAFISLQWYSKKARDSRRIADVNNIKKSLELFKIKTWVYPLPDNIWEVSYSWELLWSQWTVWDGVTTNLSRNLTKKPTDPLYDFEYIYSVTNTQKEYEILSIYETELLNNNNLIFNTYAVSNYSTKVDWTYNGIVLKTPSYILPVPSIITSEDLPVDFLTTPLSINSQIITNWENFPDLNISNIETTTWWLNINMSVYTWTISEDSSNEEKKLLAQTIQLAYTWTELVNNVLYSAILEKVTDADLVSIVDEIVLVWSTPRPDTSCDWTLSWDSRDFYDTFEVDAWQSCDTHKMTFTCENTVWKDWINDADIITYSYNSCIVKDAPLYTSWSDIWTNTPSAIVWNGNQYWDINSWDLLLKDTLNGSDVYSHSGNFINKIDWYYIPNNQLPDGMTALDVVITKDWEDNYVNVSSLDIFITDLNLDEWYKINLNWAWFSNIKIEQCTAYGDDKLWSDDCSNISSSTLAVTNGSRSDLPAPSNSSRTNLTKNVWSESNYTITGIAYSEDSWYKEWFYSTAGVNTNSLSDAVTSSNPYSDTSAKEISYAVINSTSYYPSNYLNIAINWDGTKWSTVSGSNFSYWDDILPALCTSEWRRWCSNSSTLNAEVALTTNDDIIYLHSYTKDKDYPSGTFDFTIWAYDSGNVIQYNSNAEWELLTTVANDIRYNSGHWWIYHPNLKDFTTTMASRWITSDMPALHIDELMPEWSTCNYIWFRLRYVANQNPWFLNGTTMISGEELMFQVQRSDWGNYGSYYVWVNNSVRTGCTY